MKQRTVHKLHLMGKISSFISGFFSIIFVPIGISYLFDPTFEWSVFFIFVLFSTLSVSRFWVARRRVHLASIYVDYCRAIDISEENKVTELSSILKVPEEKILRNLNRMRKEKLFPLLVILPDGTIDLSGSYDTNAFPYIRTLEEKILARKENTIQVKCHGCGATVEVSKKIGGNCPYCDSYIKTNN